MKPAPEENTQKRTFAQLGKPYFHLQMSFFQISQVMSADFLLFITMVFSIFGLLPVLPVQGCKGPHLPALSLFRYMNISTMIMPGTRSCTACSGKGFPLYFQICGLSCDVDGTDTKNYRMRREQILITVGRLTHVKRYRYAGRTCTQSFKPSWILHARLCGKLFPKHRKSPG